MSERTAAQEKQKKSAQEFTADTEARYYKQFKAGIKASFDFFKDAVGASDGKFIAGHDAPPLRYERPMNPVTGSQYRGSNLIMLGMLSPYRDSRWVTAKNIEQLADDAAARGVPEQDRPRLRDGERHTMGVSGWTKSVSDKPKAASGAGPAATGAASADDEQQTENQGVGTSLGIKLRAARGMSRFWVYNAEQVENFPAAPESAQKPDRQVEPSAAVRQLMAALVDMTGLTLDLDGKENYFQPGIDKMVLVNSAWFHNDVNNSLTAGHEIGHALGHEARCNQLGALLVKFGKEERAVEELVADNFTMMLQFETGLPMTQDQIEHRAKYAASWWKVLDKNPSLLMKAIHLAEKRIEFAREIELQYTLKHADQGLTPFMPPAEDTDISKMMRALAKEKIAKFEARQAPLGERPAANDDEALPPPAQRKGVAMGMSR
jgi:antirestriction protein ArdC